MLQQPSFDLPWVTEGGRGSFGVSSPRDMANLTNLSLGVCWRLHAFALSPAFVEVFEQFSRRFG